MKVNAIFMFNFTSEIYSCMLNRSNKHFELVVLYEFVQLIFILFKNVSKNDKKYEGIIEN